MGEAILGMPGPWAKDYLESADHYTTKIGGLPDWPIQDVSIRSDLLQCGGCGSSLCLIMQLYAPISRDTLTLKIEERTIYVFGCVVPKCGADLLSWRAIRVQKSYNLEESVRSKKINLEESTSVQEGAPLAASSGPVSKSNGLDVDSWINGSEEDGDMDLEELGRALSEAASLASYSKKRSGRKKPASIAKASPVRALTRQHDPNKPGYLDSSHVLTGFDASGDADYLHITRTRLIQLVVVMCMLVAVVPCFYIYPQQESTSGDVSAVCANYSSLSIKENQSSIDEPKEEEAWEGESYEYDRALFVDRTFLKFKKRMDAYPEQCFRYSYGGKPILAAKEFEEPKNCGLCGEPRHYEVQLMPPLLFFLREASDGLLAQCLEEWNWMTLIVYTCSKNCSSSNNWTVAEEAVVVQFEKPLQGSARLSYLS